MASSEGVRKHSWGAAVVMLGISGGCALLSPVLGLLTDLIQVLLVSLQMATLVAALLCIVQSVFRDQWTLRFTDVLATLPRKTCDWIVKHSSLGHYSDEG